MQLAIYHDNGFTHTLEIPSVITCTLYISWFNMLYYAY